MQAGDEMANLPVAVVAGIGVAVVQVVTHPMHAAITIRLLWPQEVILTGIFIPM